MKKILVVDDLPYLREVQVLLLNEAGYQTTALGDAREALERLPDLKPDLILLDVAMPGMDGREFLARLREHPRWHRSVRRRIGARWRVPGRTAASS